MRLPLLLLLGTLTGPAAADWGADATWRPSWGRIKHSFTKAATHPMTWIPALGGVAVYASGHDEDWAESIYHHTPVFGSNRKADQASNRFRNAADSLWLISILATDSGDEWFSNKVRGGLVQAGALGATRVASNGLKALVDRKEPAQERGEAEGDAFPSNHATGPFAQAALIRENMRQSYLPPLLANTLTAAGYVAATGSAYGRMEAGAHHLSDQLAGMAIGNFVAMFVNEAFMGGEESGVSLAVAPDGTTLLNFSWRL